MGRRRAWRGIHGRIADGVRARRAVGATAGFPRTGTDHDLRRLEDVADLLVEEVVEAVDVVAVHGEQIATLCPASGNDLRAGVQAQRQGGVTQIGRAPGQVR